MMNGDTKAYRSQDFRVAVNEMYEQADQLYTRVNTLTDFEKACNRAVDVVTASKTGT
jgi:hypothetical protein